VIKVEELHSYKAIAFIPSKSNPRNTRLKTKTYSTLRTSPQRTTIFSKTAKFLLETRLNIPFVKKLGDEKWIK